MDFILAGIIGVGLIIYLGHAMFNEMCPFIYDSIPWARPSHSLTFYRIFDLYEIFMPGI